MSSTCSSFIVSKELYKSFSLIRLGRAQEKVFAIKKCYTDFNREKDEKHMKSNPRNKDDSYTPRFVRYQGLKKEGLCELCTPPRWYKLKTSHYWYHVQFTHGIDQKTKKPFSLPAEKNEGRGKCPHCRKWISLNEDSAAGLLWFRHLYHCRG